MSPIKQIGIQGADVHVRVWDEVSVNQDSHDLGSFVNRPLQELIPKVLLAMIACFQEVS